MRQHGGADTRRRGGGTSSGTEAEELVLIVVGGGGAPAEAVRATVGGAGRVGAALEDEGKRAGLAIPVAVLGVESWGGHTVTRKSHSLFTHGPAAAHPLADKGGPERGGVTCRPHGKHEWQRGSEAKPHTPPPAGGGPLPASRPKPILTLAGAEPELAVRVVVGRGAAPRLAVRATVGGAGGVGAAVEGEGEVTGRAVRVSIVGGDHCGKRGLELGWLLTDSRGQGTWRGGEQLWGGLRSHRRPCPKTTALHRRSGHLLEYRDQGERRGPAARPSRRRDTRLHAL